MFVYARAPINFWQGWLTGPSLCAARGRNQAYVGTRAPGGALPITFLRQGSSTSQPNLLPNRKRRAQRLPPNAARRAPANSRARPRICTGQ